MMKTEDLKNALVDLGVELTGEESYKDLQALYKEAKVSDAGDNDDDLSDAEIEKQAAELAKQMESKKSTKAPVSTEGDIQMVPMSQVEDMMRKYAAELERKLNKKIDETPDQIEPEKMDQYLVRIPRIDITNEDGTVTKKFVVGLKNMNGDDEYDTSEKVVVELVKKDGDVVTKAPWVTLILDDGTEKMYPLLPFMDRATGVSFELLDTKLKDESYSIGKTEKMELGDDGYSFKGTGMYVDMKVTKKDPTFIVKHPQTGLELTINKNVINLVADKTGSKTY